MSILSCQKCNLTWSPSEGTFMAPFLVQPCPLCAARSRVTELEAELANARKEWSTAQAGWMNEITTRQVAERERDTYRDRALHDAAAHLAASPVSPTAEPGTPLDPQWCSDCEHPRELHYEGAGLCQALPPPGCPCEGWRGLPPGGEAGRVVLQFCECQGAGCDKCNNVGVVPCRPQPSGETKEVEMGETTLKPCPFNCGDEKLYANGYDDVFGIPTAYVGCASCQTTGPRVTGATAAEATRSAVSAWNRRTPPREAPSEPNDLHEKCEGCSVLLCMDPSICFDDADKPCTLPKSLHDYEGVPLCQKCWDEMTAASPQQTTGVRPAPASYDPMPPPAVTGGDFVPGVEGGPPTATPMQTTGEAAQEQCTWSFLGRVRCSKPDGHAGDHDAAVPQTKGEPGR